MTRTSESNRKHRDCPGLFVRGFILFLLAFALAGCGSKAPESKLPVKEYTMRGEVLRLDSDNQLATIRHEAIQGWMGAMTMEYLVKDKPEFSKLRGGERITAKVFVQGDEFWIGNITPSGEK